MDYRDFEQFGQQLERMGQRIRDAVDSFDFDQLNREIRSKAEDVIYGAKEGFGDQEPHNGTGYHRENWQTYRNMDRRYRRSFRNKSKKRAAGFKQTASRPREAATSTVKGSVPDPEALYGFPVALSPKGEVSGLLFTVFGALGLGFTAAAAVFAGFFPMLKAAVGAPEGLWLFVPVAAAFAAMLGIGIRQRDRVRRFRRYIFAMKGKSFATFESLASLTGHSARYTIRDVKRMLKLGYFPQGHIDSHKTCLMVTDAIYRQYLATMENARTLHETEHGESGAAKDRTSQTDQVDRMEALGKEYMDMIRRLNDDIPDIEFSNKLYRMETVIGKIFEHIRAYPQKADRLKAFQDYYMPMTIKLVQTYRDLQDQPVEGENIKKVRREIEGTLDTINDAYERLYDRMYQETAMDVSSDIHVLQTLLAREGLTGSAFEASGTKKDKKKTE